MSIFADMAREMLGGASRLKRPEERPRVAVLGAGPAGLLCAEAADEAGYLVDVYSGYDRQGIKKSELHGCQYLHAPIPPALLADVPGRRVNYNLTGKSDEYRRKVYGDQWNGMVSPDEYGPEKDHKAWDLRYVYDRLWERWQPNLLPANLDPSTFYQIYSNPTYKLILSTIPAPALCLDDSHEFRSTEVWAIGETEGKERVSPVVVPEFTVVCNGLVGMGWYRAANVYGYTTVEWAGTTKRPPFEGVVKVRKPLDTNCDCWLRASPGMVRVGRFGQWKKGVLVNEAYDTARAAVASL